MLETERTPLLGYRALSLTSSLNYELREYHRHFQTSSLLRYLQVIDTVVTLCFRRRQLFCFDVLSRPNLASLKLGNAKLLSNR